MVFTSIGAQRFTLLAQAMTKGGLASNEHLTKIYLHLKPSKQALVKICEYEQKSPQ